MEKQTTTKSKKRKTEPKKEIISKGVYENGEIKLSGKRLPKKKMNVIVTFREEEKNEGESRKKTVDSFIKKWSGAIKMQDIELVMEKKFDYLAEKHK